MGQPIVLRLDERTDAQLEALSEEIGFSKEMAAAYAIRLVAACMREGLIRDVPLRAWPKEASLLAAGRVIDFPGKTGKTDKTGKKAAEAESRA